jgi:hypothetical protein
MQYEPAALTAPGIVQQKPQAFGVGACGLFLFVSRSMGAAFPQSRLTRAGVEVRSDPAPRFGEERERHGGQVSLERSPPLRSAPLRLNNSVTITDASVSGQRLQSFTLETLAEQMTAREIIRARIYQEVRDYHQAQGTVFRGFVEPAGAAGAPDGSKAPPGRRIDWEEQYRRACEAFEQNGFFLLVGDRQADSLEERFEVGVETDVQFVKLMPLVGG